MKTSFKTISIVIFMFSLFSTKTFSQVFGFGIIASELEITVDDQSESIYNNVIDYQEFTDMEEAHVFDAFPQNQFGQSLISENQTVIALSKHDFNALINYLDNNNIGYSTNGICQNATQLSKRNVKRIYILNSQGQWVEIRNTKI